MLIFGAMSVATPGFAFDGAPVWRDLGKHLEGVFINTGENGLFARDEFATTARNINARAKAIGTDADYAETWGKAR